MHSVFKGMFLLFDINHSLKYSCFIYLCSTVQKKRNGHYFQGFFFFPPSSLPPPTTHFKPTHTHTGPFFTPSIPRPTPPRTSSGPNPAHCTTTLIPSPSHEQWEGMLQPGDHASAGRKGPPDSDRPGTSGLRTSSWVQKRANFWSKQILYLPLLTGTPAPCFFCPAGVEVMTLERGCLGFSLA